MARIYRKAWTKRLSDGTKLRTRSKAWYIDYRDVASDTVKTVKGFTDRKATEQRAAELERTSERTAVGLIDRFSEECRRPLTDHIEQWKTALLAKGSTVAYAGLSAQRVASVVQSIKATLWSDLNANRVSSELADRRVKGLSAESSNHYLRRLKQFARWMVRTKGAPSNPLDCLTLANVRTDRRHDRRALESDELRRLLSATKGGETRFGMTGPDRAMLYTLAVETGLRSSELRSLTWNDLSIAGTEPTVTVRAAYAKNRREDTLPLKPSTAQFLGVWRDQRDGVDRIGPGVPHVAAKARRDVSPRS
ncbi:MAG: tyrosine-type recombinase/integrase [Planctomycetota bacterium]